MCMIMEQSQRPDSDGEDTSPARRQGERLSDLREEDMAIAREEEELTRQMEGVSLDQRPPAWELYL